MLPTHRIPPFLGAAALGLSAVLHWLLHCNSRTEISESVTQIRGRSSK